MRSYLEYGGKKFCELIAKKAVLTIRAGKIGTQGTTKTKKHSSQEEAEDALSEKEMELITGSPGSVMWILLEKPPPVVPRGTPFDVIWTLISDGNDYENGFLRALEYFESGERDPKFLTLFLGVLRGVSGDIDEHPGNAQLFGKNRRSLAALMKVVRKLPGVDSKILEPMDTDERALFFKKKFRGRSK